MILRCACCGGNAPAKAQWWNRDTGYGVCAKCFKWSIEREGQEQAERNYGKAGVHHSLEREQEAAA